MHPKSMERVRLTVSIDSNPFDFRNEKARAIGKAAGLSRFSALFYVAAIGGKSPRLRLFADGKPRSAASQALMSDANREYAPRSCAPCC
jgi:hypothetical protein